VGKGILWPQMEENANAESWITRNYVMCMMDGTCNTYAKNYKYGVFYLKPGEKLLFGMHSYIWKF